MQPEFTDLTPSSVTLARRIEVDGMPVGSVLIQANLQGVYDRLLRYGLFVVVVLLGAGIAAFVLSRLAQQAFSNPLQAMVTVARRVSAEQIYSLRVSEQAGSAELIDFARSFNSMLAQIEARDQSLIEAHAQLEARVQQRTAELHASHKELEAFSYSVSHDLRAPLRHITGFASLLAQHAGAALDDQGRRYLKTITDASARMGALIDDLLAFSRMGRASLSTRRIELDEIVRDAQREVAGDCDGRRVVWDVRALPQVDADPALLRPVMVNLLSNALKYTGTRDEARIEVGTAASASPDEVVIYVRDNGVGFDMTYAHKLFGVFQRLHRAEDFAGTGIGLANVRRIIQRHGGRTWAEAEVDRGATFYFSLPVTPRVERAAS
jgi:light-regulated signal transduction histidine kinase (bacteriophytochrome)